MKPGGDSLGFDRESDRTDETPAAPFSESNSDSEAAPTDPWSEHMKCGDFEAAWQVSDAMLRVRAGVPCWQLPRHEQYIWDGRPLDGKRVLVRCYHGLGDTVQFIRYAPLLKRVAREVIVWAQPALLQLLQSVEGIDRLLPLHNGVPDASYDVDVELMELPHVFRTTLVTVPATVPYLHVSVPRVVKTPGMLDVGVVWRAGDWDDRRSVPTRLLAPLARVPGVRLHALQQGPALREWPMTWGPVTASADIVCLARTMRALDLIVSVDTFPAHLAGALGVPVWTLLHADPDWRWLRGRDDSPWYPTMRLWRQTRPGDWETVIGRLADGLRDRVREAKRSG